jgi:hypothetical protein
MTALIQTHDQTLKQSMDVSLSNIIFSTKWYRRSDPCSYGTTSLKKLQHTSTVVKWKPMTNRGQQPGIHYGTTQERIHQHLWTTMERSRSRSTMHCTGNPNLAVRDGSKRRQGQNISHQGKRPVRHSRRRDEYAPVHTLNQIPLTLGKRRKFEFRVGKEFCIGLGMNELSCKNRSKVVLKNKISRKR